MRRVKRRWWTVTSVGCNSFAEFVKWLNDSASYFIAWGYEGLPEHPSGGDVDIYVHPDDFVKVYSFLVQKGYAATDCIVNHKHAHFSCEAQYSIDLFSSFCFAFEGKTRILVVDNPNLFLHGRIRRGSFWIASPIIELLFNSLRVIGGRKDCMKRIEKYLRS